MFRSFDAVRTRTTDAAQRLPLSTATTHARHALHFLNVSQIFFLDYIILHTYDGIFHYTSTDMDFNSFAMVPKKKNVPFPHPPEKKKDVKCV